jgi:hypothetical protein
MKHFVDKCQVTTDGHEEGKEIVQLSSFIFRVLEITTWSVEKSHHKNTKMQNHEINTIPCACNPTMLDTWKSDQRAIVSLHD